MKSVCIYCGSRKGRSPAFAEAAREVGAGLAAEGYRLVFGAGDVGLMGEVSRAAEAGGARVLGFIPHHIADMEVADTDKETVILTDTMHERKKLMFSNADAVLALPGGPGTLDELIEILTWRQLGLHTKPVVLLNLGGYWDPLLALFAHIEAEGFVNPEFKDYLTPVPTAAEALAALRAAL